MNDKTSYIKIDGNILSLNIKLSSKIVYGYINSQAENFHPSIDQMMKNLRLSRQTIVSAVSELESVKLVEITRTIGRWNVYKICPIEAYVEAPKKENTSLKIRRGVVQKLDGGGSKNCTGGSLKIRRGVVQKLDTNTTNNTKNNTTNNTTKNTIPKTGPVDESNIHSETEQNPSAIAPGDISKNDHITTLNDPVHSQTTTKKLDLETVKPKRATKKTKIKYEQCDLDLAVDWISWLKDRGSHHHRSANKYNYAAALATLRTKYSFDGTFLPKIKQIVLDSDFWDSSLISPVGLMKTWTNGIVAIDQLMDDLAQLKKKKKQEDVNPYVCTFMNPHQDPNSSEYGKDRANVVDINEFSKRF